MPADAEASNYPIRTGRVETDPSRVNANQTEHWKLHFIGRLHRRLFQHLAFSAAPPIESLEPIEMHFSERNI